MTPAHVGAALEATSRYEFVGCLGRGGMGVVYEVFDRERGHAVALKTLLHFGASGLYEFKQEFRTLADVQHTNLVRLYELVVVPETREIFFTMELVRGKEFTQYVRVGAPPSETLPVLTRPQARRANMHARAGASNLNEQPADERAQGEAPMRRATQADESRLRPALRQLVAGVSALHRAGKLHRDIKPANALVTEEGRVVLLDFGVATELSRRGSESSADSHQIVGTADYMAPEQSEESPITAASDWYSVGVMLYEALVGTPPFVGLPIDVLARKKLMAAPQPSASVDGVPADLDALCQALLDQDPKNRPDGDEILRRLGVDRSLSSAPPAMTNARDGDADVELLGRSGPIRDLEEALESTRPGRTVSVFVTGPSGIGKTRLVHHFLDKLAANRQALILRGRAFEREAVPYKAFDSVMDSLSRHLMSCIETSEELSLPDDLWLLGRLFPVLQRIPALARLSDKPVDDPQTVRRRAFAALRELIGSLARQSPVVIFVDDVHWGDTDSAGLLLELVRPPTTAALLVVMTYQEAKEATPFLSEIRDRWPTQAARRHLPVGALAIEDARRLALSLMGANTTARADADAVASASKGQPFLIEELVRANRSHLASANGTLRTLSVDQMVGERLQRLPEAARRLAEIVAVGGRPLPIAVTISASRLDPGSVDELVAMVSARRLVRAGLHNGRDVLEPTYDQIRECVVAQLPNERLREHHASLAQALQDAPHRDGEAIAEHWLGAGERERAAAMAREAAEHASAKFAFDQSARLLRLAIANTPSSSPDIHGMRVSLAEALQMGGRSTDSGREYLQAAATAQPAQKLRLRRVAAEQLLAAGRIEEAEPILHEVLASCGMRAPRSPLAALFWLVIYTIWMRIRGYAFTEREPAEISDEDRMRVEALYTVGFGFGFINSVLSHCMQQRQLIEALRVGDRTQVLVAITGQLTHLGQDHPIQSRRERTLVAMARDLARRVGPERFDSYVDISVGLRHFFRGQWGEARTLLEKGEAVVRHAGNRVVAVNARLFADYSYYFAGNLSEYRRLSFRLLAEAEDRGDLYTMVTLRLTAVVRSSVVSGETERARAIVRDAMKQWSQSRFSVQHWQVMVNSPDLDIYDGNGGPAYDTFMQSMPALKKSMMLGNWYVRVMTWLARGRLAIASIPFRPEMREARIAEARTMARLLAREPNAWAAGLASFVNSSAAIASGDRAAAIAELRRTVALTAVADSAANGIAARYRLGQILNDGEGRELVRKATETLQKEWGVADLERYIRTMLPGELEGESRST